MKFARIEWRFLETQPRHQLRCAAGRVDSPLNFLPVSVWKGTCGAIRSVLSCSAALSYQCPHRGEGLEFTGVCAHPSLRARYGRGHRGLDPSAGRRHPASEHVAHDGIRGGRGAGRMVFVAIPEGRLHLGQVEAEFRRGSPASAPAASLKRCLAVALAPRGGGPPMAEAYVLHRCSDGRPRSVVDALHR